MASLSWPVPWPGQRQVRSPADRGLGPGILRAREAAAGGSGSRALFSTVITGSLLSIIPLVVAFLFLQRYWQSGLATGGVKA